MLNKSQGIPCFRVWRVRRRSREIRERMQEEELLEGLMENVSFSRISPVELLGDEDQNPSDGSTSGTS